MLWWDAIPRLGGPLVDEIDGVQIHVLDVPTEGSLPHAIVEVGGVDAEQSEAFLVPLLVQDIFQGPKVELCQTRKVDWQRGLC